MALNDRPRRPVKSLQDVRTNSGAVGATRAAVPHQVHMRLCTLEMERYRRDQERRVALERAAKCQARCEQIEAEVQTLLDAINLRGIRAVADGELPAVPQKKTAPALVPKVVNRGSGVPYSY
ncbi:MAG: hypothetical protein SFZ23_15235 [Planctomycetota bacterium]|nr:hypothetical protein [Planctomycetota bacterium]